MKPLLILTMAAGVAAAACSSPEQRRPADPALSARTETQAPPAATSGTLPETTATTAAVADPPPAPAAAAVPSAGRAASPAVAKAPSASAPPSASASAPPPAALPEPTPAASPPPPKPVAPPAPRFRDVTIPAGTALSVTVLSNLASNANAVEDPVRGALAEPVVIAGAVAVPKGSELSGTISEVKESGRIKGRASISFRFDRVVVRGEPHDIQTARVIREAGDTKREDVKKGGIGAGVGAVVGGIAGGGTGAAVGALAGGAGTVLATKRREVEVPAGTVVTVLVQEPLTLTVPIK